MAIYMNGHIDLDSHTSRVFTEFITKSGCDRYHIRGVFVESVIKKVINFMFFKFGDVQFFAIMKLLGAATALDSFLKVYKASQTK